MLVYKFKDGKTTEYKKYLMLKISIPYRVWLYIYTIHDVSFFIYCNGLTTLPPFHSSIQKL